MGLATLFDVLLCVSLWWDCDCKSKFWMDIVSEVASSRWSKFVLSSSEISELQNDSPE